MGKRTEYNKKYYAGRKDYFRQKQKEWRKNNPEHLKELKRNSYLRNKLKTLIKVKAYRKRNQKKIKQKNKEAYRMNPRKFKERRLIYKYGLTYEDKKKMYDFQKGLCSICFNSFAIEQLHIDHCHHSNKVRGLLCPQCNTSLGLLKENIQTIKNMVSYLEN